MSSSQSPRQTAVFLLDQVLGERRLMAELLALNALEALKPADRARAQRLATETLRGLERIDRVLERHLRKKPPLRVHNILRLATQELCSGGDAHGVVNDAVSLTAAGNRTKHMKGLVNAVLRKVAENGPADWSKLRVPRLPNWLRKPLVEAYSGEVMGQIEAAHFAGAPLDLTAKGNAEQLAEQLAGQLLPNGSVRLATGGQVSALGGFDTGDWWVQDAAAALPVAVLDPQPDETILDMCAAPGGKTMQLAASGASVTAVDDSETRMQRVIENLARTKLTATLCVEDALTHAGGPYDAILLDAPCSATGTIRRHPDLPHAKDGSEFSSLIELQGRMIDHAITLLKPGGRLVFCTCSLLPDEGECQTEEALARTPNLCVDRNSLDRTFTDPQWHSAEGGLRLRPDFWSNLGGLDGFYIVVLRLNSSH